MSQVVNSDNLVAGPQLDALVARKYKIPVKPYSTEMNSTKELINAISVKSVKVGMRLPDGGITVCVGRLKGRFSTVPEGVCKLALARKH